MFSVQAIAAGPFEFGVKIGVPFTDVLNAKNNPNTLINTDTQRYTVGGSIEVKLPLRFSVEGDVLYQSFSFRSGLYGSTGSVLTAFSDVDSKQFEFPILAKYRFSGGVVRPYVGAGASFRRLSDIGRLTNFVTGTNTGNDLGTGFVAEGGVQFKLLFLKVSPELRFTRWGVNNFQDGFGNLIRANRNQGEFLLGISF